MLTAFAIYCTLCYCAGAWLFLSSPDKIGAGFVIAFMLSPVSVPLGFLMLLIAG